MCLEKRVLEIRNLIKNSKKPVMFFDTDADGCTSYFQLKKAFPKIRGFYMRKENQVDLLNNLEANTDLIIIFDIPFLTEDFFEASKNIPIIWADHHLTNSYELIKKYDVMHLNPLNYDENDNRPSSYLAYLVSNLKKNLPLACLGSVSDFFVLDILIDLYESDEKSFNLLFKIDDERRLELFDFLKKYKFNDESQREKREFWIKYLTYECNFIDFKNLFDLMFKLGSKDGDEVISNSIKLLQTMSLLDMRANISAGKGLLFEDFVLMKKKYKKILKKTLEKQKDEEFVLFEYKGKSSFTRQIAEELSYRFYKFKVIGVIFKTLGKDYYTGSFRGNNFDVNTLVSNSVKGLDGNGGGHKFAAGCRVHKKDYPIFKERILENFK